MFSFLAVVLTIGGPGVTIDEPLDVRPGRTYVETFKARGLGFFDPTVVDQVFRDNAEHPPLGRWLLGIASETFEPVELMIGGSRDPIGLYIRSGRVAPALAFGLMVGLVASDAGRRYGRTAGLAAGLSLMMMPRVFAHAHLAALDTFIACFWSLALLSAVRAVESDRPGLGMVLAGLVWGLALLTKIHAWFLPPIVLVWCLISLRPVKGLRIWLVWLVTGLVAFFAGWPWIWFDPVGRLKGYLGTGIDRVAIQVLYFGQVYRDVDVPWHYPWVYLAVTVPVGLLVLGLVGLLPRDRPFWLPLPLGEGWGEGRRRSGGDQTRPVFHPAGGSTSLTPGLSSGGRGEAVWASDSGGRKYRWVLVGSILLFPAVFSTKIPVYDGERLFLIAFPLMAILIGRGFSILWDRTRGWVRALLVIFFVLQGYGLVSTYPFGLSEYNLLVGGLPGAERLGLELTYWGDAVDGSLLDRLAREIQPGETVAMVPTLAPDQGKVSTSRALARIPIVIADQASGERSDWLIVSRRSAYWPAWVADRLARDEVVLTRSRQGIWLSVLLRARKSKSP